MKYETKIKLARVMWWSIIVAVLATALCAYDTVLHWIGVREY